MHSWRSLAEAPATARTLDTATFKRIQWLFERVCRHGYGAESSLKSSVQIGAMRMSEAGATRDAIRSALNACLQGQTTEDLGRTTFVSTESRVVSIRKRVASWADAAVAPRTPVDPS